VTERAAEIKIHDNLRELDELLGPFFETLQLNVNVSEKRVKDFDRVDNFSDGNRRVDVRV
jgi:hypothetical protein